MTSKKVLIAIFSAFGLIIFTSILAQLIAGIFIEEDTCKGAATKKFRSPDGELELAIEFRNCTLSGGRTQVLLYELSNPNTAEVLVGIEEKNDAQEYYPVPIEPNWLGAKSLEIYLPLEHIPNYTRDNSYGATIRYHPIRRSRGAQ